MTTEYATFESLIDELLQPDQPGQKLKPIVLEPEPAESAPLAVPTVAPTQRDRPQRNRPQVKPQADSKKQPGNGERPKRRRRKKPVEQAKSAKPQPIKSKPPTADGETPKRKRRRRRRSGQGKPNSPKSGGET